MLETRGLTRRFGGLLAVNDVTLTAPAGSITGLIGPNGAGKTTLFAMIAGFVAPTAGRVAFQGADVTRLPAHGRARAGLVRTFQIVQPFAGLTVHENIAIGSHLRHPGRSAALSHAAAVARRVGLADQLQKPARALTIAGRKRLELARALATDPAMLLLDEVLAGLTPAEIEGMLPVLRAICDDGVAILMIEHVMQAVMRLCSHVSVLNEGRLVAAGPPRQVAADPAVIDAYLGAGAAARIAADA